MDRLNSILISITIYTLRSTMYVYACILIFYNLLKSKKSQNTTLTIVKMTHSDLVKKSEQYIIMCTTKLWRSLDSKAVLASTSNPF